ncbi:MAG: single-stranded DNA-binding protein [Nitrospinaceae bacterium]|jgi:single-strand DNA-binding protein|tara:strand:+ start:2058 stop:2450 length:393 start_codon:yes stop_codon:yes gene_type:complete
MASFNKVMLMGNLTRDPELRYTSNGSAVTSFGLAVNRKFKQGDEWKDDVCFVDITVWGKQGENCAEYLSKGRPAFIEGFLKFSTWESDGQKRNKLEVVASTVQFLGSPGGTGGTGGTEPTPPSNEDDVPF